MRRTLALLAALGLLVAACGGTAAGPVATAAPAAPSARSAAPSATPAATAAAPETLDGRFAKLYEAAKAEGTVSIYSSLNTGDATKLWPLFEKRFPGVKVDHTRSTGEQVVQKIITEKKAGQDLFDMIETNNFEVKFIIDQGYTQPYKVFSWNDFAPGARDDAKNQWIADRQNKDVIAFNTSKVQPGEIKTYRDLCNKKYEGHIAVEQGDAVVYTMLKLHFGEAEAQSLLKCIAANKPSLRSGHTDTSALLAAGEFWIELNAYASTIAGLKNDKKAPVAFVKTDPTFIDIQLVALSNKPKHPNAGKLLMEWLTSPEGQTAIASVGREAASSAAKPKYPELLDWAKGFYNHPDNSKYQNADTEFWRTTFGIK